jgi:RNA polymerase sigma-70 factor (ECF subfamily)
MIHHPELEQTYNNNESLLIKRLKSGDPEAFNQLFNLYSARLYHFGYGYLKSKDDAEELVQETFCRIWEKKKDIKEEFRFSSYLFTIAFNHIRKQFRAKALLLKYMTVRPDSDENLQIFENVDYPSLKMLVDRLVGEMPEKRKTVFIRSRYEGKSAADIASEMHISKSTVENHLNQALKFLRSRLKEEHFAGGLLLYLFMH